MSVVDSDLWTPLFVCVFVKGVFMKVFINNKFQ